MSDAAAAPARAGRQRWVAGAWSALGVVAVPFVLARAVVLGALGVAHLYIDHTHAAPAVVFRVHQGLLAWDAGFYESIARSGYHPFGHAALRFFPLFPLAARALSWTGMGEGPAVVLVANLGALIGTALLVVLVRRETGDPDLARRSAWLLSLAPPAFTLVLGYAEGLLLVFTTACFLCIRPGTGRRPLWWGAAAFGFAAALTRPLGVVLVLPIAVEAWRRRRAASGWEWPALVVGVLGPLAGLASFLGWAAAAYGDFLLPLRVQTAAGHHGRLTDPVSAVFHDADAALHHHLSDALHLPWVVLVVVLVVVVWRTLPASYGAFATGVILIALSGTNLDSFERYALSAFPLVIAGAMGLASKRVERTVLSLSGAGMFAYALAAFLDRLVP